jgi:hypothetical protein
MMVADPEATLVGEATDVGAPDPGEPSSQPQKVRKNRLARPGLALAE